MRLENVQAAARPIDPRRRLCETKYFGLRPQPLEQYLYRLRLPQVAERVFWLHWDLGNIQGDFTSTIALSEVARRVHCDTSTVTRAYQTLKSHGLLRRQDPGRDPSMPFAQAIALTEVLIPAAALAECFRAPDRHAPAPAEMRRSPERPSARAEASIQLDADANAPTPARSDAVGLNSKELTRPEAVSTPPSVDVLSLWQAELRTLENELSADDFAKWLRPLQAHVEGTVFQLFAPNPFVLEWVRKHLDSRLAQRFRDAGWKGTVRFSVGSRPNATSPSTAVPTPAATIRPAVSRPRQLGTFCLARLRGQLAKHCSLSDLDQRLREVVWSVEQGALAKREIPHALNTALKLIREGQWTRPNRMPPNWRLAAAQPEPCGRA